MALLVSVKAVKTTDIRDDDFDASVDSLTEDGAEEIAATLDGGVDNTDDQVLADQRLDRDGVDLSSVIQKVSRDVGSFLKSPDLLHNTDSNGIKACTVITTAHGGLH
jgi:hypothetical protein